MDHTKLLLDASLEGNVSSLVRLLQEDPLILDRDTTLTCSNETPLHVASMLGHLNFVTEILAQKTELAMELDSRRFSPLHLASTKGHLEIAKALILVHPDMCLTYDRDGRNPLHLAAIRRRVEVLKELIKVRPLVARATVLLHRRETILHLCVRHNQFEALKLLPETLNDHEFVNSKDDDGHTILHVAVAHKQMETIKFLLLNTSIEVNETNADGVTAMGILARTRKAVNVNEIKEPLRRAGAFVETGNKFLAQNHTETLLTRDLAVENPMENRSLDKRPEKQHKWLEKKRSTLMVVASLIATMAFQVGVNPLGGVWQDSVAPHKAGLSIMADIDPHFYNRFLIYSTTAYISSRSIILLLISGLPFRRRIFMWILMVIMWIAVTATSLTFTISISALTPDHEAKILIPVVVIVVLVWIGLMGLLILAHTIRILFKRIKKLRKLALPKKRIWTSRLIMNQASV